MGSLLWLSTVRRRNGCFQMDILLTLTFSGFSEIKILRVPFDMLLRFDTSHQKDTRNHDTKVWVRSFARWAP
jgi:hypothetical protein